MEDDSTFSERELGQTPERTEGLSAECWGGLVARIETGIGDGSFGERFPMKCSDGPVVVGCNRDHLWMAVRGEVRMWPHSLDPHYVPPLGVVMDGIEFFGRLAAKPILGDFHSYFGHNHVRGYDHAAGLAEFRGDVNRIFKRCGHPYILGEHAHVTRTAPAVLHQLLVGNRIKTGERQLDELLRTARDNFLDCRLERRREALKTLWDAWERLKSYFASRQKEKNASFEKLLEAAIPDAALREHVDKEAKELTEIGNEFSIRHSEVYQGRIETSEHLDYLFHRLFALIWMLVHAGGLNEEYNAMLRELSPSMRRPGADTP